MEAEANVVTNFDISGRDAIHDAAIPRLDTLLVQSTFQQLKSADEEIKAGIAEAVARQLAVDAATTVHVGDAAAEFEGDEADAPVPVVSELPIRENAGAMDNQPGTISRETDSASLPEAEPFAAVEEVNRPIVSEPAGQAAEPDVAEQQEVIISETTTSGEAISQELFQEAASLPEEIPDSAASQQAAMPGLEALRHASPEQIAAMMAYLQTLQASKSPEANAETAISQVAAEQQTKSEESFPEATTPSSLAAEAVATMTESAEPTQPEKSETLQQTATESPALDRAPTKDAILEPAEVESDFVVDPIPDTLSPEEEAIVAMTQELEQLPKVVEEVTEAEPELPFVPESLENAAVADAPEQTETLESSVTAVPSVEESANEALTSDYSLDSVRDEELERRDQQEFAEELAENEDVKAAAFGEAGEDPLGETLEPSRIPRNVAAYYLQPLRRVAEYGVPACDLQLRSYSVRPLESFCDFALRAAYYLGLPAYGPVPLPKIIERWTVPKSSFIFKKSQENFERITRRRLIQIKDAHPETVQIWLAFLQKHQQAAVGMKANIWEFSSIGTHFPLSKACAMHF